MLHIGAFARLGQVSPRTLRYYDEVGLLKPARVDAHTGYRTYDLDQLARLHRLLALRELGLSLEQVRAVLDEEPAVEQLRGMLRLRRAQLEAEVADQQARLRRVEAHLRALERTNAMTILDVVIKVTEPVTVAEASCTAPGFGHENLAPAFARLVPRVLGQLDRHGMRGGMMIAWYDEPDDDGHAVVHAGFVVRGATAPLPTDGVSVAELPAVRVASVLHRGPMDDVERVYEALVRWIDDSGHELAGRSRELYLEWDDDHPERNITELQMPITD